MFKRSFIFKFTAIFILCALSTKAQTTNNKVSISSATYTNNGIVFTNEKKDAIFIMENSSIINKISGLGVGYYFNVSDKQNKIGFKLIKESGLQIPCYYDLSTNITILLNTPVESSGQVFINSNGTIVYTIGTELNILKNNILEKVNLGYYANLTPISNNDLYVSFNDNNDQIWIYDLELKSKYKLTTDLKGYFNPKFSNDSKYLLYQALNGEIFIYNIESKTTNSIGIGFSPNWAKNTNNIVYYKTEIKNEELINSDIYIYDIILNNSNNITNTSNKYEIDPSFNSDDTKLIYSTLNQQIINESVFSENKLITPNVINISTNVQESQINYKFISQSKLSLNIPYVHQVYDVPDWHSGYSSCAPATAAMLIAFYGVVPPWSVTCSSPFSHYNNYGRYICERYRYRQVDYNYTHEDPGGSLAMGGYGYMWHSGSPYSNMANYYRYHGIASTQTDSPPHSEALTEIQNSLPYSMCVGLTSSGHLILAHGLGNEMHTLVFHDPYGDKNGTSYPAYNGQYAKYDWPGYNNGYENLNTVWWCIKTKYNLPAPEADTLVDDMEYATGFYLHNKYPASMLNWSDKRLDGYNGHFWYTTTNSTLYTDVAYAKWTPTLTKTGLYDVQVYIPYSTCKNAIYKIYGKEGLKVVNVDQSAYTGQWVSLGNFVFTNDNTGYLRLGDASDSAGVQIVFDAARWVYIDSTTSGVNDNEINMLNSFYVNQNYPNPFNPSTSISYGVPSSGQIRIQMFNELGELIKIIKDANISKGTYTEVINLNNSSSGHLFINIVFTNDKSGITTSKTIKAMYLK
ncbi:MAG: hypothetical protein V1773_09465 [bacterium]